MARRTDAGSLPTFCSVRSSRIPRPTKRSRRTSSVLSCRPGRGWARCTNTARQGSADITANGSVASPSTVSENPLSTRVSLTKSPSTVPLRMSPDRPQRQKDEPSTRVTAESCSRVGSLVAGVPVTSHLP
jgi:hypothetical protein